MNLTNWFPNQQKAEKRVFGKDITNICNGNRADQSKKDIKPQQKQFKLINLRLRQDAINFYHEDIFKFISNYPHKTYAVKRTADINDKMKQILIDWLIDVQQSMGLKDQTLYLAFNYLYEFQNYNQIKKQDYQLVGITCLWIASKYEEIYPPRINQYAEITAKTYSKGQIKNMQGNIISFLDFELSKITPIALLNTLMLQQFRNSDQEKIFSLTKFIIQLAYLHSIFERYNTVMLLQAALKLAQSILNKQINQGFFQSSKSPQFCECYKEMCLLLQTDNKYKLTAVRRKYQKQKYHNVGKIRIQ